MRSDFSRRGHAAVAAAPASTGPASATPDTGNTAVEALLERIRAKRDDVDRYLTTTSRRGHALVHITILAGSISATLTASAALGGKPLADWLTETFALATPSWRILCAIAALCSLATTVATRLHSSHSYEEHIARARGLRAALEALEVSVASGHVGRRAATGQYIKYVEEASFIASAESR